MSTSMFQPGFSFPMALTEKYRPTRIADFVGLDKIKRAMTKLAANPYPSAWLFIGPSGTGKTTMGLALAEEMPGELHHIPSQECTAARLSEVRRICQYVPMAGKRMHIILIDEADRMTDGAQIACLSLLDSTNFPPNTIFVFTCNATDRLEPRFLSRCCTLEFSSYGIAGDAAKLLEKVWDAETDSPTDRPNFARLVKENNNNLRGALMDLQKSIMTS